MYNTTVTDKKSLNMLILEILRVHADAEHRLRQDDIIHLLEVHFGVKCDRRSIKSNILSLIQLGYSIPLKGGYCLLEREFNYDELRVLMDSVFFSRTIPRLQKGQLVKKLQEMGSKFFQPKVKHIAGIEEQKLKNTERVKDVLERLDDAISQRRQVSFIECQYGEDFMPQPISDVPITVNPYQILAANERFYLVANPKDTDFIAYYPIDLIDADKLTLLDEKARSKMELKEPARSYRLPKNLAESVMPNDSSEAEAQLRIPKSKLDIILDWFGKDFQISCRSEDNITVTLCSKEDALFRFAMQYGDFVEVLEPENIRKRISEVVSHMGKIYAK